MACIYLRKALQIHIFVESSMHLTCHQNVKKLHICRSKIFFKYFLSAQNFFSFRESTDAAKPHCFAVAASQSQGLDLFFCQAQCAHGRQCEQWGIGDPVPYISELNLRIANPQTSHLQGPRAQCQSNRRCSCSCLGRRMCQHATLGRCS